MKNLILFIIITFGFIILTSCGGDNDKQNDNNTDRVIIKPVVEIPKFNSDSAFSFVKAQTDFGPRVPKSKAHKECLKYLYNKLNSYADTALIQTGKVRLYTNDVIDCKNVIGTFNPENSERILLCAHWDSRPYADWDKDKNNHRKPINGANDGASGVGVLLEIARLINQERANIGIDIIFFDVEDYGEPHDNQRQSDKEDTWGLGSQYWSKNPHNPGYFAKFGILLDMVGAKDAKFTKEGFSVQYAPSIVEKTWNAAKTLGYENYFLNEQSGHITDDHYYINKIIGIPTIDIIHRETTTNTGFFEHWHTINDNIDIIDKTTLNAVGETVLYVIFNN